jgi:hypothetical protein
LHLSVSSLSEIDAKNEILNRKGNKDKHSESVNSNINHFIQASQKDIDSSKAKRLAFFKKNSHSSMNKSIHKNKYVTTMEKVKSIESIKKFSEMKRSTSLDMRSVSEIEHIQKSGISDLHHIQRREASGRE